MKCRRSFTQDCCSWKSKHSTYMWKQERLPGELKQRDRSASVYVGMGMQIIQMRKLRLSLQYQVQLLFSLSSSFQGTFWTPIQRWTIMRSRSVSVLQLLGSRNQKATYTDRTGCLDQSRCVATSYDMFPPGPFTLHAPPLDCEYRSLTVTHQLVLI